MINPFIELEKKLIDIETLVISLYEKVNLNNQLQPHADQQSDIIFIKDVCSLTNLKKATIYQLVNKKAIPIIKPAGTKKLMFSRAVIISWLQSDRMNSNNKTVIL